MRMAMLAVTAIVAGGIGLAAGTTPAAAQGYPICMHWKYDSVLCNFRSMAECMATASGIGGDCIQNPGYAIQNPGYAGYDPPPPRRIVRHHHYYHHHKYRHRSY